MNAEYMFSTLNIHAEVASTYYIGDMNAWLLSDRRPSVKSWPHRVAAGESMAAVGHLCQSYFHPTTTPPTMANASSTTSTGIHWYCEAGLFHSKEPLHTHRHCKNCFRMGRCEGRGSFKLLRCGKCCIETYCVRFILHSFNASHFVPSRRSARSRIGRRATRPSACSTTSTAKSRRATRATPTPGRTS